jgi:hypothetical protein
MPQRDADGPAPAGAGGLVYFAPEAEARCGRGGDVSKGAVKPILRSQWNDGVDDARAASGSMKRRAKMVVVRATV